MSFFFFAIADLNIFTWCSVIQRIKKVSPNALCEQSTSAMVNAISCVIQDVIADVSKMDYVDESLISEKSSQVSEKDEPTLPSLWLMVMSVHDPMNVGSLIRSAYYLGTEKVVVYNGCQL